MINTHPSKLLLFGEYTIIKGSKALAMPYMKYRGNWAYGEEDAMQLNEVAAYLAALKAKKELKCDLDITAFQAAIDRGLHFKSNIPTGYGLGSSGALTAAIYQVFCDNKNEIDGDLQQLKSVLGQIENFFHGSSSGIDPLVCYLNSPILYHNATHLERIKLPVFDKKESYKLFLFDTKKARNTETLVNAFVEKCKDKAYLNKLENNLIPLNNQAIDLYLKKDMNGLFSVFDQISHFQKEHFTEMMLTEYDALWEEGLKSKEFKLKICGAGGGGFILGIGTEAFIKKYSHQTQLLS